MLKTSGGNIVAGVLVVVLFIGAIIFMSNRAGERSLPEAQQAKSGDRVSVNYTGELADGTIFDSNIDPRFGHLEPFEFVLGAGQVIPGWDKGIVGMRVGEKKRLEIPPEDAYGEFGIPGIIPPNATLFFDVELLAIKN